MADFKVVITDLGYATYEPERGELAAAGDIDLVLAECVTEDDVAEACKDADAVITRLAPVGVKAIAAMEKCQAIARYGVGVDNVDVAAATEAGIPVCNVRDYCLEEVSDLALALMMTCARRTSSRDKQIRAGGWDIGAKEPVYRIAGKTLGIVGYGAIPRTLRRKVSGFNFKEVLIFDPFVSDEDAAKEDVRKVELNELCEQADYISIHAPLIDATRGMIGAEQFAKMKPTAILVNTSRGPVVDTAALVEALKTGQIMSAGVDVYDPEPPPKDSPLFDLPNVTLTDHTGWYSEESQLDLQKCAAKNIALVLSGEPPMYCVNPEVLK
jgi:D-3-phosphoglycerate dehydrogenase / 2-oxoglutarate reductase